MRTSNPRSVLVGVFRDQYLETMDPDKLERTSIPEVEDALEQIECYIRAGWHDSVGPKIEAFEEKSGIDFRTLAADAPGIEDPRR